MSTNTDEHINRIVAVVTHENGKQAVWDCETVERAVWVWHREMTAPTNASNPAVAVEWIVGAPGGANGLLIGAMKRPDPPRREAWATVVGEFLYSPEEEEVQSGS